MWIPTGSVGVVDRGEMPLLEMVGWVMVVVFPPRGILTWWSGWICDLLFRRGRRTRVV